MPVRELQRRLLIALSITLGLASVGLAQSDSDSNAAQAQTASTESDAQSGADDVVSTRKQAMDLVKVDWFEEAMQGGITMIVLGLLSVALLAFAIERAIAVRQKAFVTPDLLDQIVEDLRSGSNDQAVKRTEQDPSTMGRILHYLLLHRHESKQTASEGAADLAGRDVADHEARLSPFSAIAALAPLLGLLGTMIGMIEAFKLVEVFGDEGGASMLAGSISKALITTATGLVIAVPAIAVFYFFKHRVHVLSTKVELEAERAMDTFYADRRTKAAEPRSDQPRVKHSTQPNRPSAPSTQAQTSRGATRTSDRPSADASTSARSPTAPSTS